MTRFYVQSYDEEANEFNALHVEGGGNCRVDPMVSCALKNTEENYAEVARACVGKTYSTPEENVQFTGRCYIPNEWNPA